MQENNPSKWGKAPAPRLAIVPTPVDTTTEESLWYITDPTMPEAKSPLAQWLLDNFTIRVVKFTTDTVPDGWFDLALIAVTHKPELDYPTLQKDLHSKLPVELYHAFANSPVDNTLFIGEVWSLLNFDYESVALGMILAAVGAHLKIWSIPEYTHPVLSTLLLTLTRRRRVRFLDDNGFHLKLTLSPTTTPSPLPDAGSL